MTPSAIIDHFEHAWKDGEMLSTNAQLDQYVLWISEHWDTLSAREREVMLSVGAAVFRQWMSGASVTPAFSATRPDAVPEVVPVHHETGDAAASCRL
ncbi:MAG: hypothetical protein ACRYHA_17795 [Janthinobacterium lividum]